jgi:YidC/Oxa1 family membrane protein insertase
MFDVIAGVLAWFYAITSDYSLSISLLTLIIMLVFTPLTLKGTRSMMRMQELQPELKRIQTRNKNDRQKLNEEMMALYSKNGVSPLGGCLPSLVQLPVFFVLYRVINGLAHVGSDGEPDPKYLDKESDLYVDLVEEAGQMVSFGVDLSRRAVDVLKIDFVESLPYLLLVGVTFILSWFQQKQMKSRRGNAPSTNQQMEMLMKIMPYMLPVFAFMVPAALGIYFIASSLYRIGQQAFIHATMKPVMLASTSDGKDDPIDVEEIDPVEITPKEIKNRKSNKALAAEESRREERAERSKKRQKGNENLPKKQRSRTRTETTKKGGAKKPQSIQSKRTSGDGRTRKKRK